MKEERHIKIFKKNRFKSKLKKISSLKFLDIKNKIKNKYFKSKINDNNLHFIYEISKHLILKKKILSNTSTLLKVLNTAMRFFIKKKIINLLMTQKQPALPQQKKL